MNNRNIWLVMLLSLMIAACASSSDGVRATSLTEVRPLDRNQTWQLVSMRGREVKPASGVSPTTIFFNTEAGTYGGHTACNGYGGNFSASLISQDAEGDRYKLTLKPGATGSVGCPDAVMNAEERYLALLRKADGMLITAYSLSLTQRGKEILKFELQ